MTKNKIILIIIFILLFGGGLWFLAQGLFKYYSYRQMQGSSLVMVSSWEVVPKGGDNCLLRVHYSFEFEGRTIEAASLFSKKYLNYYAAKEDGLRLGQAKLRCYFDPQQPERASLERHFPWTDFNKAGALLLVLGYFFLMQCFYWQRYFTDRS